MDNQEPPSKIVLYHLQLSFMAHQNSTPTSFPQVEGALEHARQEKEKLGRIQRDNLHMAYVFDDFVILYIFVWLCDSLSKWNLLQYYVMDVAWLNCWKSYPSPVSKGRGEARSSHS